jgi:hypothetical protein
MNNNRSGTSQLSMSVPKLRALLHEAYKAGRDSADRDDPSTPGITGRDLDAERREYIKQVIIDLNWR